MGPITEGDDEGGEEGLVRREDIFVREEGRVSFSSLRTLGLGVILEAEEMSGGTG